MSNSNPKSLSMYIGVTDMNRALHFYKQVLGAEPASISERFSKFVIAGVTFGLLNANFYSHRRRVGNNCVPVFEVEDIQGAQARIEEIAPVTTEVRLVNGFRLFEFADADGNVIEFIATV